jgi:hypothetical protein
VRHHDNRESERLVTLFDKFIAPSATAPALLDLAATQLGLGKLRYQVQRALNFVPERINTVLRQSVRKIVSKVNVVAKKI